MHLGELHERLTKLEKTPKPTSFPGSIGIGGTDGSAIDGVGVLFPASFSDSSDSNALDDYEEGTWLPTLTTTGTDFASVTYDPIRGGRYTKIGNVVHVQGLMRTDAVDTTGATGTVRIGNLPFAAIPGSSGGVIGTSALCVGQVQAWGMNQPIQAQVAASNSNITLLYKTLISGAASLLAISDVATGANSNFMYFAGTYIAG
jgi:hypothetical protein